MIFRTLTICLFIALNLFAGRDNVQAQTRYSQPPPAFMTKAPLTVLKKIVNKLNTIHPTQSPAQTIKSLDFYLIDSADHGFGCKYYRCGNRDTNEFRISLVFFNWELMEYAINCNSFDIKRVPFDYILANDSVANDNILRPYVIKRGQSFFCKNEHVSELFRRKIASELGTIEVNIADLAHVGKTYESSYQLLMDPIYDLFFGDLCGISGNEPPGKIAVDFLLQKANFPLIRPLMSGYNAVGRIFAIEALLRQVHAGKATLTNEDKVTIRKVFDMNLSIMTCEGCSGRRKKGREAIPNYLLELL